MAQFYPDEVIQEVAARNDIVDIIAEYVRLKRSGKNYSGLCPFHNEKTPSFSVTPDKQLFHCFGCGAGGTVINFIMRIENLDFIEAIKLLAEKSGFNLPEENYGGNEGEKLKKRQIIYSLNIDSAKYFHLQLISSEGEGALQYLSKRGISEKTIVRFGLGYAVDSWDALKKYLIDKGYSEADVIESGLAIEKSTKGSYDRFRNRIIYPIIDVRGNVVGFGGRVMDNTMPKYLNSPETIVFNKSRNLYGLNFAKSSGKNSLLIVEGYMDVISLHQNGITNVVASLGTALTNEQATIIKKYCSEVIIAYDSDTAGQAATLRGIDILADVGLKVKVLSLKEAKDPDEFIRLKGVELFKKELNESKSLIEYKIDLLKNKFDIDDIEQKIEFVNEMAKIFARVQNSVERDAYIRKIAEETNIGSEAILSEIRKLMHKDSKTGYKGIKNPTERSYSRNNSLPPSVSQKTEIINNKFSKILLGSEKLLLNSERNLLNLFFFDKGVFEKVNSLIKPEDFSDELHRRIVSQIYELKKNGQEIDTTVILTKFEGRDIELVTSILHAEVYYDDNYKAALQLINVINKHKKVLYEFKQCIEEGNVEKLNILLTEIRKA